jgi:hypothetical protein
MKKTNTLVAIGAALLLGAGLAACSEKENAAVGEKLETAAEATGDAAAVAADATADAAGAAAEKTENAAENAAAATDNAADAASAEVRDETGDAARATQKGAAKVEAEAKTN